MTTALPRQHPYIPSTFDGGEVLAFTRIISRPGEKPFLAVIVFERPPACEGEDPEYGVALIGAHDRERGWHGLDGTYWPEIKNRNDAFLEYERRLRREGVLAPF